jgi:Aldehyde dehydrogenase family
MERQDGNSWIASKPRRHGSITIYGSTDSNHTFIAASWAALGITYNTGQDCTAGSRVYVQDSVYDKFLESLVNKVKAQVVGDGLDPNTGAGPVVSIGWFILREFQSNSRRFRKDNTNASGSTSKPEKRKAPKS